MIRHVALWIVLGAGMVFTPLSRAQDPNSQPVYFADGNLKATVEEALGVKDPNVGDMLRLEGMDASRRGITDLTGLEYAVNLTGMYLDDNQIADITPLAGLTKLSFLRMRNNRISDISPLAGLVKLNDLDIGGNQISDISSLAGLTEMGQLWLANNPISDIRPLAGMKKLFYLYMAWTQVADISPLAGLIHLRSLGLSWNQIEDISALSAMTELDSLGLDYNRISDISPLSGLTALVDLNLGDNQISDISPLRKLTNLERLNLWVNRLSDISVLASLKKLTGLYMYLNQITDITALSGLTGLTTLSVENNQISDISPLSDLTGLTSLSIHYNQIQDVAPLAGLTELTGLSLHRNKIADIRPLAGLTKLTTLQLDGNQINDISILAGMTNLTSLELDSNKFSDIRPLVGLTSLTLLCLAANQISDIGPLASLTRLVYLRLGDNGRISSINALSGLTNLTTLAIYGNQIADLKPLSGLMDLTYLDLRDNHIHDISPLAGLTKLTFLSIGTNQISDINSLAGLKELTGLYLGGNQISDISPLAGLTRLTHLDLSTNWIRDISPLSGLRNIAYLYLPENRISDIDSLEGMTEIVELRLDSNNEIRDINALAAMANLTHLDLRGNQVKDISPLSGKTKLNWAWLAENPIRDISPLISLIHLGFLGVERCPLKAVAYGIYLPQIRMNNPGIDLRYDKMLLVDDNAPSDPGPGDPLVSDPCKNGTYEHPYDSIQEAIDAVGSLQYYGVLVMDGLYSGEGNRDLVLGGKSIAMIRSDNGPQTCIIDCQGSPEQPHRGFYTNGDNPITTIDGFTITGGYTDLGGAVYSYYCPGLILSHCILLNNRAKIGGGGIYSGLGFGELRDCVIRDNSPDGMYLIIWPQPIVGEVKFVNNSIDGDGSGGIWLKEDSTLLIQDGQVRCHIDGPGTILIPSGSEATLAGDGSIWLVDAQDPEQMGLIQCDGKLLVTDQASITDTTIQISPDSLGLTLAADANLTNNDICTFAGDGTLWLDPNGFSGTLSDNRLYMTVEKGSLLELRGLDLSATTTTSDQAGVMPLIEVPAFDANTWTIEQLTVQEGARVRLVDRFDDQNDGPVPEVGYIRRIVLEPHAVLDVGFKHLYYQSLQQDPTAQVVSQAVLGFSLGVIGFDDPNVLVSRVSTNNVDDPCHPRLYVTREPNGLEGDYMRMRNLADQDAGSPTYGQVVHARAKARFARSAEDRVLVKFKYLFETVPANLEMVVSLSDVPELLEPGDPNRSLHYKEVGRVFIPNSSWPGSPDSGRYGRYEQWISTFGMDLSRGTWVELELVETASVPKAFALRKVMAASTGGHGGSAAIDDLAVEVATCGGICMDLNWSTTTNEEDFMLVMASYGGAAGVTADLVGNTACMEGLFSRDGYVDSYDVYSWDWALNDRARCNLCAIPMAGMESAPGLLGTMGRPGYGTRELSTQVLSSGPVPLPGQLLILGKRSSSEDWSQQKLEDRVYVYDEEGRYGGWVELGTDRCTQRMIRDGGCLYSLSMETAVCRMRDNGVLEPVVPPARLTWSSDPRYLRPATIGIGIQGKGNTLSGRPVWDAAFSGQYGYVAPVVVMPEGAQPYRAAARLELDTQTDPPYRVVQLYDDPLLSGGGQSDPNLNGIREIEVDEGGSVYVLNADSHTYSDILWAHRPDGRIERLVLDQLGIDDPIGLCVSNGDKRVYVGSGYWDPARSNETVVYGFSTEDLSLSRTITIRGMQGVTGMCVHPRTGVLWVVGVSFEDRPLMPSPMEAAFYRGYLAVIRPGEEAVQAIPLTGTETTADSDLALPTSIVWTGF